MNSPPNARIQIGIHPMPPLASLEEIWLALDQIGDHSFFLTWNWIGAWLRTLPSLADMFLVKVQCREEVVGLAVLTIRKGWFGGVIPLRKAWLNSTGDLEYDC